MCKIRIRQGPLPMVQWILSDKLWISPIKIFVLHVRISIEINIE